jgi:hypothetical protein
MYSIDMSLLLDWKMVVFSCYLVQICSNWINGHCGMNWMKGKMNVRYAKGMYSYNNDRLCHHGVVRSLSWRQQVTETNVLQFASGGEDHSVRIFKVDY